MRIAVLDATLCIPLDPGAELAAFSAGVAGAGAVVTFTGLVRGGGAAGISALVIEHYPGMTERALTGIAAAASTRWSLTGVLVLHRVGTLAPGAPIMMVATAAPHRADAFAAAEYLMDYLKTRAPFWKKEVTATGERWVAPQDSDAQALARW